MKRAVFFILALFASVGLFAQQQHVIAVTPFEIVGNSISREEADVIYELFITELSNTKGLRVVDRDSFAQITAQMKFQASDWSDDNKVAQFGNALNATTIIRGQCMPLAGKIIISTRIIDVNTTESLSGAPLQMNNLNEIFNLLPGYVANVVKNLPKPGSKIGERGPGGGIIFYAENGTFMECSLDLGSYSWSDAIRMISNYKGGNFSDWRLPTRGELDLMYKNLNRKGLGGFGNSKYWSSEQHSNYTVWYQDFGNGSVGVEGKAIPLSVRAVRQF